ncbi:hypothetical protein TREPR_0874 [Treponema primitia ZAS-2]|uniref:Uncharacterized protein n=1 Tax=Treponema primitia (strain ATCC BAA-887 / DSM 12427 / ZAS-2) TaxID=545694 RepID=F5YIM3_TREPZ|nr:hypothetical protein TREPR_0874 [Treponema primitia ZAS-2]
MTRRRVGKAHLKPVEIRRRVQGPSGLAKRITNGDSHPPIPAAAPGLGSGWPRRARRPGRPHGPRRPLAARKQRPGQQHSKHSLPSPGPWSFGYAKTPRRKRRHAPFSSRQNRQLGGSPGADKVTPIFHSNSSDLLVHMHRVFPHTPPFMEPP